jgi:hypothetical protein
MIHHLPCLLSEVDPAPAARVRRERGDRCGPPLEHRGAEPVAIFSPAETLPQGKVGVARQASTTGRICFADRRFDVFS